MNSVLVGILAFLMVCVVWTWYNKQEGFTSGNTPKDTHQKIKDYNNELNDVLNIATYRTSYEEMILELEKWADNSMLNVLAQGKIKDDTSIESVKAFNELAVFKKNLNDMLTVLDKSG